MVYHFIDPNRTFEVTPKEKITQGKVNQHHKENLLSHFMN